MLAAVRAARKCGDALHDASASAWLEGLDARLAWAVEQLADAETGLLPDDATRPARDAAFSQQVQALALWIGVTPAEHRANVEALLHRPPPGVTRWGSPFPTHFVGELWDNPHDAGKLLDFYRQTFRDALLPDLTTLPEVFPDNGFFSPEGFASRSYCHGWSASPMLFLPRAVLGIRPTPRPGCAAYTLSPWIEGFTSARGRVQTPHGPIEVEWERSGNVLDIACRHPARVTVESITNRSLAGVEVRLSPRRFAARSTTVSPGPRPPALVRIRGSVGGTQSRFPPAAATGESRSRDRGVITHRGSRPLGSTPSRRRSAR